MYKFLYRVGEGGLALWDFIKGHTVFSLKILIKGFFSRYSFSPVVRRNISKQLYYIGIEALLLLVIMALIIGMSFVSLINRVFFSLDVSPNIGDVLSVSIVHLAAPLACGMLLVLRSSTAIFIDIWSMKNNNELNALEAMNIDPYVFIFFPRLFASILSMVVLSIIFSALSIIGGYLLISFESSTSLEYILSQLVSAIDVTDFAIFFLKVILAGFIIASIPMYMASNVLDTTTSLMKAMMRSMIAIFVVFIGILVVMEFIF